jgi:tetratricopeptide (TPR) repeat protein
MSWIKMINPNSIPPGKHKATFTAFLIASSLLLATQQQAFAAADISEADNFLIKSQFKEAEQAYRGLINNDETGDAYAGLAVSLAKQSTPNKISEAEKILRKARDKFADNPNVIASGAFVSYIHSQNVASPAKHDLYLEAAQTLCERAIKANPDILIAQETLGMVKIAEDDYAGALDPLKKANSLSENPVNMTILAHVLLRLKGNDAEAEELIDSVLKFDNKYSPAHLERALLLVHQGQIEDAFSELNNIAAKDRDAEWYSIEGDIYRRQGDGPAALNAWREAIRLDPHSPQPYRSMAEYYAIRGDGELAISQMHDALEILPNDMALRTQLAELALRQDKLDVAESEYRTILAVEPEDPNALLGLSRVYFRKARRDGQYPPGWQHLMDQLQNIVSEKSVKGQVITENAKQLEQNIELSEAEKALSQGHFREASDHFSKVIGQHHEDPYELLTLGEQAFNDGDLAAAEQAFNLAKDVPEIAPRAEQGLSRIATQRSEALRQTKLGDATWSLPEVAVDHYKQALIADPQNADAYYGLFCLTNKTSDNDPKKAVTYGESFLEAADDSNPHRRTVESTLERLKKSPEKKKSKFHL